MDDPSDMSDAEFAEWLASRRAAMSAELTAEQILAMPDSELDDELWMRVLEPAIVNLSALPAEVQAFYATRNFEWEVGNGGLHQFFFNNPDPAMVTAVIAGYRLIGLDAQAKRLETIVAPLAKEETEWRESLRDGHIETFFDSYISSQLPSHDAKFGFNDQARLAMVRANADLFATF